MAIDPTQLKTDVETAITDIESVVTLVDNLPLPQQVKDVLDTAKTVLDDVQAFLSA